MALTALAIFKLLPKTNCRECNYPTCLAFAMQLAAKKASLDECPYVSDEAKAELDGASVPPIRLVTIGKGDRKLQVGNETVLFRHEQTFYHPTGLAVEVGDDLSDDQLKARVEAINRLKFERVGLKLEVDLVAVRDNGGDAARYAHAVETAQAASDYPLVLISDSADCLEAALKVSKDGKPLICGANEQNLQQVGDMAKAGGCPLVVRSDSGLEKLAEMTQKLMGSGLTDLLLDVGSRDTAQVLSQMTLIRRSALKKTFRPLGFPTIAFADAQDPYLQAAQASAYLAKYASIVVVTAAEPWQILPILTVRQNIFTDPQKPIQVKPGIYSVGNPDQNSPVLVTTNFSLTYYTVEGDVEASRVPAYIAAIDTEGTSVLTAWAAEKLTVENVTEMLNQDGGAKDKVGHRKVIIPGLVAVMTAKLKEQSGWEVLVGPKESSGIPRFLKSEWSV